MARSRSDAPFIESTVTSSPVLVVTFRFGLLAMTWILVMTVGPSGVLTMKPVPSALSPVISTTARAWSSESLGSALFVFVAGEEGVEAAVGLAGEAEDWDGTVKSGM